MHQEKEQVYASLLAQVTRFFRSRSAPDAEELAAELLHRLCRPSAVKFILSQRDWILKHHRIPKIVLQEARRLLGQTFERKAVERQNFQRFAETTFREGFNEDVSCFRDDEVPVATLDDRHRLAVKLRCDGFNQVEIAKRIGVSTRTIRNWQREWRANKEI